jgi:anti-sigma factor RsiW
MAECSEISLMLGGFEDAELEPNEMQEVAHHLARCDSCSSILSDFSTVGRELRSLTPALDFSAPNMAGFADAVIARIDRLPQPWYRRVQRYFGSGADFLGSGFAWGGAVAAVAMLTMILLTPYAQQLSGRKLGAPTAAPNQIAAATVARPSVGASTADDEASMADNDSHAVISRLESGNPSVAVWSEPRKDTTVIWLPDQP